MALLGLATLTKDRLNLSLTRQHLDHLSDLSDQFSRVRHDDYLYFHDGRVNSHQTWHDKGSRLPTTIHRLEGVIESRVIHDVRDRDRLNNRWLEVVELGESSLDGRRHS